MDERLVCRHCGFPIVWDDGEAYVWPGWLHARLRLVFCRGAETTAEPVE